MKLIFVALAAILCGASAYPSVFDGPQCESASGEGIRTTIRELLELIPLDKVVEIFMVAVSNDQEVQEVMEFVQSDEFVKLVTKANTHKNFGKVVKLACDDLYLDAVYYLNIAHDFLGWPAIPKSQVSNYARKGLLGMLQDILDVVPVDKIHNIMKEKIVSDKYVKRGVEILSSADFVSMVEDVTAMPEYKYIESELAKMGIPVSAVKDFLEKIFGWKH